MRRRSVKGKAEAGAAKERRVSALRSGANQAKGKTEFRFIKQGPEENESERFPPVLFFRNLLLYAETVISNNMSNYENRV